MSRRLLVAALAAALVPAAAAAPAAAQTDGTTASVAGGATTLTLDPGTADVLAANGVSLELVAPATPAEGGVTFPVDGGAADPATLFGDVQHAGGLRFAAGGRSLTLRSPTYVIKRNGATLTARVGNGGPRVSILRLDLSSATVSRDGLTVQASGIVGTLTATAAAALNDTFDVDLFAAGLTIGTVHSDVVFGEAIFAGGETRLDVDDTALGALTSLGIGAAPIGPATAAGDVFAFPITTGRADAATLAGVVGHAGGIALTKGTTTVNLTRFTISTDGIPYLSALVNGQRVRILDLDLSGITVGLSGTSLLIDGVEARLTAVAAAALNRAFGTTAFAKGLLLGTATVDGTLR